MSSTCRVFDADDGTSRNPLNYFYGFDLLCYCSEGATKPAEFFSSVTVAAAAEVETPLGLLREATPLLLTPLLIAELFC